MLKNAKTWWKFRWYFNIIKQKLRETYRRIINIYNKINNLRTYKSIIKKDLSWKFKNVKDFYLRGQFTSFPQNQY